MGAVESVRVAPGQDTVVDAFGPSVVASAGVAPASDPASRIVPMLSARGPAAEIETKPEAARFVAPVVMAAAPVEAPSPRVLATSSVFDARAMPARTTVEPLQQMTTPTESRRSRMLTAMVSTASLETSARTTERVASRIDEERLYNQVHRIGARGDRLSVKF